MQDLVERAEQAVELARRAGADAAEAFVLDAPEDAVLLEPSGAGEFALRTANTVLHRGLGLAARWGRRVGFASTTDLSPPALAEVVNDCRRAALPDDPALPLVSAGEAPEAPGLADKRVLEMNLPEIVGVAMTVGAEAREAGVGVLGVVATATCRRVAIVNSAGLVRSSLDTRISAGLYAMSRGGGFAMWSRTSRSLAGLLALAVGRKAAALARSSDDARDVVPGLQTVVLRPDALLSLLATSLGPALGADRVAEGTSPFAAGGASPGDGVASAILDVTDDATRPGSTGSYLFDAEGTAGQVTPVIRAGRLVSLLHNNYSAASLGLRRSTGNASRDRSGRMSTFVEPSGPFGYRPGILPSSLVVTSPGPTFPDLPAAGVDRGLLVQDVMGAFVIDPAVGDFSVTTTNAWALERGRPAYPVKRAMLSGNMYSLLKQVVALAEEPEDVVGPFSLVSPSWVVADLVIV